VAISTQKLAAAKKSTAAAVKAKGYAQGILGYGIINLDTGNLLSSGDTAPSEVLRNHFHSLGTPTEEQHGYHPYIYNLSEEVDGLLPGQPSIRWYASPHSAVAAWLEYAAADEYDQDWATLKSLDRDGLREWASKGLFIAGITVECFASYPDGRWGDGRYFMDDLFILDGDGATDDNETHCDREELFAVPLSTVRKEIARTPTGETSTAKAMALSAFDKRFKTAYLKTAGADGPEKYEVLRSDFLRGLDSAVGQNLSLATKEECIKLLSEKTLSKYRVNSIIRDGHKLLKSTKMGLPTILPSK
jgi:hypothetical protein